jgi:glyoxylase-like metal-dependent hydrolase (beta-lactamase superfamily II)
MQATLTELERGAVRVTMPLPWALDHVHCYVLPDPRGATIVDCGLGSRATTAWWEDALARIGRPRVRRIVVTHYHPDHVGAGAALVELTGAAEVVQGELDARLSAEAWGGAADADGFTAYLRDHGMPADLAARSTEAEAATPVFPARPTRLVDEGDTVEIGGEPFSVLVLPGHADGHIALLGAQSGRLFSADVLLEEITPNVGRWPDTRSDPLGAYLHTLDRLDRLPIATVLPGHGPVIHDHRRRTAEIRGHHAERLDAHQHALRSGAASAYEVATVVWQTDGLGFHEQRFALVEAISHLERLEALGRARRDGSGGWRAV